MESPFFYPGCIKPEHPTPWQAMVWREPLLTGVIECLLENQPEFVTVVGPVLSGKTTFVHQLIARIKEQRLGILPVFLDMAPLCSPATEKDVARHFVEALTKQMRGALRPDGGVTPSSDRAFELRDKRCKLLKK